MFPDQNRTVRYRPHCGRYGPC